MDKRRVMVRVRTDGRLHSCIVIVVVDADGLAAGRMIGHHGRLSVDSLLLLILLLLLCSVDGRVRILNRMMLTLDGAGGGGRRGDGIIMWIRRVIAIWRVNSIEACRWRVHGRRQYQVGDMRPLGGHHSQLFGAQIVEERVGLAES